MNGMSVLTPSEILRQRARALAQAPPPMPEAGSELEVLVFRLADERYALETCHVQEVQPLRELTPLPCTPAFLRGLVNLRGRLLPVIDLKRFFDLPERGISDLHRILLLRTGEGGGEMEIGLLADTVEDISTIPLADLQTSLPTLGGIRAEYLKGVTGDRLVVLDALRILADPRIVIDEEVEP